MNQNLQNILELQGALTQLREAERRLLGIPDWMRELHDEHETRKAEIQALEESAAEATRQRRTAEAAVQDAQEKLKKYQQQINRVTTQREYGALLQ
jgi:predicted  nucleic acid-binding Zn-ribbon protein